MTRTPRPTRRPPDDIAREQRGTLPHLPVRPATVDAAPERTTTAVLPDPSCNPTSLNVLMLKMGRNVVPLLYRRAYESRPRAAMALSISQRNHEIASTRSPVRSLEIVRDHHVRSGSPV